MNLLQLLFGSGQQQGAAPQSRVGNTYQGQALPAGTSSLLASSQDSRGKRVVKEPPPPVGKRQMGKLYDSAPLLLADLFGEAQHIPGARIPSEREGDAILDRSGFFDPGNGNIQNRTNLALEEWYRALGLGRDAARQSPFFRPTRRMP